MMNLSEFKADMKRETGARMSKGAWAVLYSQYCEAEAEAIAGGRDDAGYSPYVADNYRYDAHDPNFDLDSSVRSQHSFTCLQAQAHGADCICHVACEAEAEWMKTACAECAGMGAHEGWDGKYLTGIRADCVACKGTGLSSESSRAWTRKALEAIAADTDSVPF